MTHYGPCTAILTYKAQGRHRLASLGIGVFESATSASTLVNRLPLTASSSAVDVANDSMRTADASPAVRVLRR